MTASLWRRIFNLAFLFSFLVLAPAPANALIKNGANAIDALGQISSTTGNVLYTKGGSDNGSNSVGLHNPNSVAIDIIGHRLFVSDSNNGRVLVYTLNSDNSLPDRQADYVLGQPDFDTFSTGTSQAKMGSPYGLAYDSSNKRLFVADFGNNRVMVYAVTTITNGMNAAYVLGQTDFVTSTSGVTQAKLSRPTGLSYDSANQRLFVSDQSNNRVLVFGVSTITNGMNAAYVLGQTDFVTGTSGTTQAKLSSPGGLSYDSANQRLFVSDTFNYRVMIFYVGSITNGMNAVDDVGQTDALTGNANFTKGSINNGPNAVGNASPSSSVIDNTGHRLFVADRNNCRILVYTLNNDNTLPDRVADYVLGQTDFDTRACGTTQAKLSGPYGLSYDSANQRLFVSDQSGNRVLVFDVSTITNGMNAAYVLGQTDFVTGTSGTTQAKLSGPGGLSYDSANQRLFVADMNNRRVMVYNITAITNGMNATYVLGQSDFISNSSGTTQATISTTMGVSYDSSNQRLFVVDTGNYRVMVFNVAAIANGMNAAYVLGQTDFVTGGGGGTQSKFGFPIASTYDSTNQRLFVVDQSGHRVMVFNVASVANGMNADYVLGQTDFVSNNLGTTQARLRVPYGADFDPVEQRLYVVDNGNNRVLVFNGASITNGMSAMDEVGQADSLSGNAIYTKGDANNGPNSVGVSPVYSVFVDGTSHRLFVADYSNNRVLVYNLNADNSLPDRVADYVLGQTGFDAGDGDTTQATFNYPRGLTYDSTNQRLYVVDYGNNRVLVFNGASITNGMNGVDEVGQKNSSTGNVIYTKGGIDNGPNSVGYYSPSKSLVDSEGHRLFVADGNNHRVLVYTLNNDNTLPDRAADYVLGQVDFDTRTSGTTQSKFDYPYDLTYDSENQRLFVADQNNNRVMIFNVAAITNGMSADYVLGQADFVTKSASTTQSSVRSPAGITYDPANHRLFVAESTNNRITIFNVSSIANGMNADYVLGQTDFVTNTNGTTQAKLKYPYGLAYDSTRDRLFVADFSNHRVMVYPTSSIVNGMNASYVLGQSNFTTNSVGTTQAKFNYPIGLSLDIARQRLFVADRNNSRVMVFNLASIANGMNADYVLGQPNFTTGTYGTAQAKLSYVQNVFYAPYNNSIYASDVSNNRIMVFDVTSITGGAPFLMGYE